MGSLYYFSQVHVTLQLPQNKHLIKDKTKPVTAKGHSAPGIQSMVSVLTLVMYDSCGFCGAGPEPFLGTRVPNLGINIFS